MSGKRVAYDVQTTPNRILVWNVGTGATTKVSGNRTAGADDGGGVFGLAIAGTQVAWSIGAVSNEEADADLYSSSVLAPKERHVRGVVRYGDACGGAPGPTPACAGTWLGGPVAAGSRILVNRWTTDTSGAITGGGLYALHGTKLTPFVNGGAAVEAVAADARRVAVVQWRWYYPDATINVFSASGKPLATVTPTAQPKGVALSGRNLLVLEAKGKLVLYDAKTGALKRTFTVHRGWQGAAIAVHGNVAVYSTPLAPRPMSRVRALNLTTGKDRLVGRLPGQIPLLRMDSFGLVYANYNYTLDGYDDRLVFRPFAEVAAAVR
jgi:outer membrane protein assembly factor BamB